MMKKFLKFIFSVAAIGAIVFLVTTNETAQKLTQQIGQEIRQQVAPCSKPLTYSIDKFDKGFNISQADFLQALKEAEAVWEKPSGKDLFEYSTPGLLKINLIYDTRQEATQRMKQLGLAIDSSRSSYDKLRVAHQQRDVAYKNGVADYDSDVENFEAEKTGYEKDVDYWNEKGGAPKPEYQELQERQRQLNGMASQLNSQRDQLNQQVNDLNAIATQLNKIAGELNLNVDKYNTIGSTQGEEFQEGVYKSDATGQRIEIYQFDTKAQLVRVLAHELGHALGMEHVEDKDAIMFRLNQSKNGTATKDDLEELNMVCKK